jgi:hypothetical protein
VDYRQARKSRGLPARRRPQPRTPTTTLNDSPPSRRDATTDVRTVLRVERESVCVVYWYSVTSTPQWIAGSPRLPHLFLLKNLEPVTPCRTCNAWYPLPASPQNTPPNQSFYLTLPLSTAESLDIVPFSVALEPSQARFYLAYYQASILTLFHWACALFSKARSYLTSYSR